MADVTCPLHQVLPYSCCGFPDEQSLSSAGGDLSKSVEVTEQGIHLFSPQVPERGHLLTSIPETVLDRRLGLRRELLRKVSIYGRPTRRHAVLNQGSGRTLNRADDRVDFRRGSLPVRCVTALAVKPVQVLPREHERLTQVLRSLLAALAKNKEVPLQRTGQTALILFPANGIRRRLGCPSHLSQTCLRDREAKVFEPTDSEDSGDRILLRFRSRRLVIRGPSAARQHYEEETGAK